MACSDRKALVTVGTLALALTMVRVAAGSTDPGRIAASPAPHPGVTLASATPGERVLAASPCDDEGDGGDEDDGDDNS